jgi:hypothetical protein
VEEKMERTGQSTGSDRKKIRYSNTLKIRINARQTKPGSCISTTVLSSPVSLPTQPHHQEINIEKEKINKQTLAHMTDPVSLPPSIFPLGIKEIRDITFNLCFLLIHSLIRCANSNKHKKRKGRSSHTQIERDKQNKQEKHWVAIR